MDMYHHGRVECRAALLPDLAFALDQLMVSYGHTKLTLFLLVWLPEENWVASPQKKGDGAPVNAMLRCST